ncbi:MAG: lpxD2 [Acidobacteria bacterium]|nr:lpxD2 [Acidobacteriota bacterium]
MTLSAADVAALASGRVVGDPAAAVSRVATPETAVAGDLVFVEDQRVLDAALHSAATVVLAGPFAADAAFHGAVVVCEQPRLAFARAARRLSPPSALPAGVHPTAVVAGTAGLGRGVAIGPYAVVDDGAVLGDRVQVGAGSHVGQGVRIGEDSVLRSHVVVYPGTTIGKRVILHAGTVLGSDGFGYVRDAATGRYEAFPQVGRLVVEDDVEMGTLCTVDRGALGETVIGRGTKLDNQVHVAHNVRIGRDVVIAAQTGIAGSSVVEDGAVIAGQVGIADHVRIGSGAILGAQCGVPTGKEIRGPGVLFWGTPARPIRQYLKELATLARLTRKK